ncbi:MAG: hypothetical protein Ct9H300mP21_05690 [Pseudomonadota bacterium]|nr:MAG: hypothetical protein Ct9H300mP21_05690 [Pseudomonadota bacterium]
MFIFEGIDVKNCEEHELEEEGFKETIVRKMMSSLERPH